MGENNKCKTISLPDVIHIINNKKGKIDLVKLTETFDREKLRNNLIALNDKDVQDYLGFNENIDKELDEISYKLKNRSKHILLNNEEREVYRMVLFI